MSNVKGREVAEGENVLYKIATGSDVPALSVEQVSTGENVTYRIAGAGEIAAAIITLEGSVTNLADPWNDLNTWNDTYIWSEA